MARLYIFDRMRGEYGHLNNTTTSTETRDKFNVSTEVARISRKTVTPYFMNTTAPTTTSTQNLYVPNTKQKLLAARLIPNTTIAKHTVDYVTYTLQKGTTALATAIATNATTVTAGTALSLTLTAANVTIAASSVVNLKMATASTPANGSAFTVQLDLEEAK